ncbi:MAG: beta-propeller fold lactonase family protein [Aliidongia sp.]
MIDAASGTVTIPTGSIPYAVAFSPDGSRAYVANNQDSTVSVISTAARANIATIAVGPAPMELAVSPDGSTRYVDNSNEFKNPDTGSVTIISTATDSVIATVPVGLSPDGLAVTPDGSLVYVINTDSNSVSVIATATNAVVSAIPVGKFPHGRGIFMGPGSSGSGANTLAASVLPGGRSVEVGTPATIFATLLNAGTTTADTCGVALAAGAPSGLSLAYQTTNPATNAPTGQSNSPVSIVAGGYQTFLLTFASGTPLSVTQQPLDFSCSNAAPAPSTPGVDTIDLTFSSTPITDMVALAATHDGTLHLTQGQPGAFAVATINLGAAGGLIASADTGSAALPISLSLCETNPSTGQCLSAPAASASVSVGQNATPTFSIFATTAGPIAFAPGTSRIFVLFKDAAGAAHGSTSVAVVTQ